MEYVWSPAKADANYRKHGVRFSDAAGVLEDEMALVREDLHAVGERRFVATGLDFLGRTLVIVFTHRQETLIRLISARVTTRRERRQYEKGTPMSDEISEMRSEYDMGHARRGPVVPPNPRKTRITIRLDTAILNWFRDQVEQAGGGSYQTNINEALREHIRRRKERLEDTLRRVVREELQAVK